MCPAFRARRRGALWRVVRAVDSRRTRSMNGHGRVTTANADLRRCAREGGTGWCLKCDASLAKDWRQRKGASATVARSSVHTSDGCARSGDLALAKGCGFTRLQHRPAPVSRA